MGINRRTLFLFLILCIPLQVGLSYWGAPGNGKAINLLDIPLIGLLILGIPRVRYLKNIQMTFGPFLPGLLMGIWAGLSTIISSPWKIASGFGTLITLEALVVGWYVANYVRTEKDFLDIIRFFMFIYFFVNLVGFGQYVTHSTLGLGFLGSWGMRYEQGWERATGTLQLPNVFASFLIMLLPMAFTAFLTEERKSYKYFYLAAGGLGLLNLIITFSRSAWIGFAFSVVVFMFLGIRNKRLKRRLLKFLVILAIAGVFPLVKFSKDIIMRSVITITEPSRERHRIEMLKEAPEVIMKNPLFGTGLWAYISATEKEVGMVHNTYLLIAGELGIPGILFFLWALFEIFKLGAKVSQSPIPLFSYTAIAILAGFTAFLVQVVFTPTYRFFSPKILFWFLAGLLIGAYKMDKFWAKLRQLKMQGIEIPLKAFQPRAQGR